MEGLFIGLLVCLVISLARAYGTIEVIDFVESGGSTSDASKNAQAWINATTQSTATGRPIYIPPGNYHFTTGITGTDVRMFGAGCYSSGFTFSQQLGLGKAAVELYGNNSWIRDMGFTADFSNPGFGQYGANFYGLRLNGPIQLRDLYIQRFYAGVVWNSPTGGTLIEETSITGGYYGIYVQNSGGYNSVEYGGANGVMASVGIAPTAYLDYGDSFFRVHMCFGPYGFYQEGPAPPSAGQRIFMQGATLQMVRFEACGNGAIFTENAASTTARGIVKDTKIANFGFVLNAAYQITSRNSTYGVTIGSVQGSVIHLPWSGSVYNQLNQLVFLSNATASSINTYEFVQTSLAI
eukprot:Phypoly_transcript_12900.p1 GENE.Phypoly_transcript_12900~~Phypoly_transcript_12900.p1  ORF type:complete len:358 (+),score=48.51 Phypoly_transcript_12900:22-1074(+)